MNQLYVVHSSHPSEAVKHALQSKGIDTIDEWIAAGVLGGARPNAADLEIGSSLRLLSTIGDLRPLLHGRPCDALARRLFADYPGDVPAGAYPSGWLPARA